MILHINKEKRAALTWANEIRSQYGQRPLWRLRKGDRGKPHTCPISMTIMERSDLRVITTSSSVIINHNKRFKHPKLVEDFINHFDHDVDTHKELRA